MVVHKIHLLKFMWALLEPRDFSYLLICFIEPHLEQCIFVFINTSIHLCIPDYLSPTRYNPTFLSWNDLEQNENNDFTRRNTIQKNAPFHFQTLVIATSFISTVWDFEKRPVVLIWILSLKIRFLKWIEI